MNRLTLLFVVLLVGACASNDEDDQPDAIDDFIAVSDLERTDAIRSYAQLDTHVLNSWYVIVYSRKEQYLLAYNHRCRVNYNIARRPDLQRDGANTIYADSGTFRGCKIKAIYPITVEQAAELIQIGRAPGER
jgi:hypothetical protein